MTRRNNHSYEFTPQKEPKEVPILVADDLCKNQLYGPEYTCCLSGWVNQVFDDTILYTVLDLLSEEIFQKKKHRSITRYNDGESLDEVAKTWNIVMARLGYTVGNPEAKNVK